VTISTTNSTAATGALYADANPAATPVASTMRAVMLSSWNTRRAASPAAAPNWISGPSRPSELPEAIASHDANASSALRVSGSRTRPSTIASITKPTPAPSRSRAATSRISPTSRPPTAGSTIRSHAGMATIIATLPPPPSSRSTAVSAPRNAIANPAATSATAITASQRCHHREVGAVTSVAAWSGAPPKARSATAGGRAGG